MKHYLHLSLFCLKLSLRYLGMALLVLLITVLRWIIRHLIALWKQAKAIYHDYRTICILSMIIIVMGVLQLVSVVYIYKLRAAQDLIELNQQRIIHESDSIRHAEIRYRPFYSNI